MRKLYPTYCKLIATLLLLGCSIALSAQGKTYHVKVDSEITTSSNDGLSWENAITLTEALSRAKAGDEIWVKGYEDITGHIYKAPKGGFVLPSGVAMYGGFAGDETIKNDLPTGRHKYQMKYQTALVGDIDTNDKASQQLIIYPENTTRTDNAPHVLTLQMGVTQDNTNDGNKPTIVSGFLIAAGNAKGENTSANGRGGGIYVVNNSNDNNAGSRYFRISQCNFANNYGMRGGAIYVDNSCTNQLSAISYCSIFNNVAGKRGSSENEGGGMWIDGTATVYNCNINNNTNGGIRLSSTSKIVNCSVIANTVSAADLTTDGASNSNGGGAVYNTVLWHSTALSKQDSRPAFYSCAFPEVEVTNTDTNTDANGNVWISNENHGIKPAPWFKQSAVTQGYDFSFSSNLKQLYSTAFTFEETSALLNKGKLEYYTNNVVKANLETTSTDIMGRTRYQTSTIDIGAYEYARMKPGRIRYVKPEKEGKGDGSTWNDATDDIQWAINDLAEKAPGEKGEVWVAAGTYEVKERILTDASSPVSLLMKNGISVYGAFNGTEEKRSKRIEESKDLKPWGWKQESIIRGSGFKGSDDAIWNNSDEAWNIQNSESYHVVWFAPLPEGEAFTDEVYLEGFTIEGGTYKGTGATQYAPGCGAGVYINDPSARMRYCTVRFCNSDMKESGNIKPRGGGIYCKNGQTEGNLVYDCSAYQGGGIYIDEAGFITRSMVTNCSAYQGSGVYLKGSTTDPEKAYYQILATSVISNNTSTRNGAVYLDGHGLVINNTIVNNYTNNTSDAADERSSYTGGVYIAQKGLLANNVIWNNSLLQHTSSTSNSASMAQIYAANPSEKTVQFYNNAISDVNAAKWTRTYQSGTISINTYYSGKGFVMGNEAPYNTVEAFNEKRGVLTDMKTVNYYWETLKGTRLRNVGISYALLPSSYLYQPKIDLSGKAISSVPSAGAYIADNQDLVFEKNENRKRLRIYFDRSRELVDGTGQSWEKSYTSSSVDEILGYLADIKDEDKVKVVTAGNTTPEDFTIEKNSGWEFEICGREGIFEPKIAYTFEETDARSCTFNIQPCVLPVTVYGGYPEYSENPNPKDEDRDPIKYRTELNGNLNGSELNEGLYHLVRIEAGANITIDGYAFTHAYAAGTAYMPYGGGVLIGSMDQSSEPTIVKLKNCIFENNTATDGGAIATMPDAVNVKLELENCVINNNTSKDPLNPSSSGLPSIIYLNKSQGSNNSLTLNHVSIINNEGVAPDYDLVKRTSYAVGNKLNINGTWNGSECKNSMDINTLGKNGAVNFSNPTNEVGAKMSGNVYYGGYSSFRPLTSSAEAGRIINSAQENNATTTAKDITGEDRNLGGVPDLGAYEALLPKAGKIIYVRSYNQKYESISDANNDDQDGNPNFNILNESDTEYDGSSWDKAIIGNAMCDNNRARTGNDFYVTDNGSLLNTTIENEEYSLANRKYRSETDSYGNFWTNSGNQEKQYLSGWGSYNKITNNRDERYISGLQYAVEKAAELNKIKKDSVVVWVGAGIYTDYKGFVIRDNVKVYGGFPYDGYPGEDDRHPLLSQYVPARKEYENLDKTKYETILQIRKESPVYFKNGDKEMWYQEDKPGDGSKYDFTKKLMNSGNTERHYVLYQPDVCLPTWSPSGDGNATRTDGNAVRYKGNLKDDKNYVDYEYAKWDGFSVRHGYIINYPGANRDGGAGVRVFRGVELENLIIVNNFNHGSRVRGGGLYMDGENSKISNSYMLRNLSYANSSESYGGGAYMIQGTGYNLVVANNRCYNGTCRGGGIFLESAKFYNNTIAYNMATNGTGIYHWQDANTGVSSQLSLYNCIIYDNYDNSKQITDQVNSAASGKMNPSHNCYMNSSNINNKFQESDGNFTGTDLAFPFEDKTYENGKDGVFRFRNARLKNNFRLNEADGLAGNKCLNGGTTNVGNGIILPETDMDYTNRIKDCAIDIGAYEADNTTNIAPQEKTNSAGIVDYIYYVTQNGWGNRSGDRPENAACADKLQDVLTAAGKKFETENRDITDNTLKHKVYVKVAGYQADETGKRFTYHANTLADPSDPQSYTFLIPNGVRLMGGYYEGDQEGGKPKDGTANWDNDKRDCISSYQTVLSAKTEVKEGSAVNQEVNGYHTVCFGKWPTGDYDDYNTTALTENTIIDGCRLIDGNASDKSGFKSMGGAAIVPRKAHVRNCEISDCQATQGGALMLLKGSIVSGSVIVRNKAQKGGAIYALRSNDKNEDAKKYHAYVISCTIAKNEATIGGGIYQEENSLIGGNSVIWGNSAQTDNNISGDVNYQSHDFLQGIGKYSEELFYPYNYCFVEKMALPANRMNTEMTSDLDSYFNDNKIFKPRAYSPLISNGVEKEYVNAWENYGISSYDITGKERTRTKQQTAGAYTSDLPAFDDTKLLKRLFVSQTGGEIVTEEEKAKYYGRSFLTPFNSLEAAIDYINEAREKNVANDNTHFEILMTGGTYKPSKMRQNKDLSPEQNTIDRRLQSFTIPVNVDIFGSFSKDDLYSSTPVNPTTGNETGDKFTSFDGKTLVPDGNIKEILANRNSNNMTDKNKNGLIEPWEFQDPTILSGDIKASEKERNVYHVVYSNAGSTGASATLNNEVVLDGITITNGETMTELKTQEGGTTEIAEIGRGGGIYTNRVNYTLNRCRLMNNAGLHGGAIYVNNASLDIIGSTISGNRDVSEKASQDVITEPGKGGAIYLYLTNSENGNLHIINSLLANNDVTCGRYTGTQSSQGGAIFIRRADDADSMEEGYQDAYIVNSLIVNNKAMQDGAIHVDNEVPSGTITPILYNTAIWGNESTVTEGDKVLLKREHMRNCAWDELPASSAKDGNIKLNKANIASDGPRFTAPTTTKGYEGYTQDAKWNPQAISVLTDAGDGKKKADDANKENEEGKYFDWWNKHEKRLKAYGYRSEYIRSANSSKEYNRYVGPKDENGNVAEKPIDIGMYEFQYVFKFTDFEKVYIGTEEKGNGDGSSWDNQSTDLRGAIIAMANPSGNVAAGTTTNNSRKVFVRGGTYYSPTYISGDAFSLIVNKAQKAEFITSIELVGGCTGSKNADGTEVQDFSKPSVLIENPAKAGKTTNLLNIVTNGKPITISGFTFQNQSGVGVNAKINNDQAGTGKEMRLHHCAFRENNGTGMVVNNQKGYGINMWNVLFADGKRNGLTIYGSQSADITNATFVCNKDTAVSGTDNVYNSVAWKNSTQDLKPGNKNVVIANSIKNGDVLNGPNFVDPTNGDYRIRPSLKLLDQGSNDKYQQNANINSEKDLGNTARLIGVNIDIGAYECDTKLRDIIYVKEGSAVAGTGESWDNPTNDLQGAINLAELYANKNAGKYGYVFVDRNLKADNVNISMPGVKMFGSMREEKSSETGTEAIVKELLTQRKGIIESASQSTINGLTLNSGTTDTRMCVVDGFKVSGDVSLQGNSMLSTSILDANVSGDASSLLYNSLALGTVKDVKSVNVTASGELPSPDGSAANRASVTTYNKYVKDDYWKYQLDETDNANINANADVSKTKGYIDMVMHNHDLAGNQRIRDNVDNGCFETWYLTEDAEAKKADYPHGKSVVYVMTEDQELKLNNTFYTETNPFSPGFLLLKHHAGLRGNNSYVNLTNFAVERNLKAGTNFFSMPFKATNMEVSGTDKPADGSVIAYYYNAATRAKYDYKFDQNESEAWVRGVDNQRNFTAGFRMDAKDVKTVRFYGISYTENGSQLGQIILTQNNNQQPWSSSNGGGLKFTHKENMGWNLFGSPYLCAMNYDDMEYGRIIYQCEENGIYKAINTYDLTTGVSTDGYIPAMDAVFTQTATLDNSESVIVRHSEARATTAYQATRALDIAITQNSRTSRAGNGTPADDQLQLNAVPAQEAKSDFDLGSDGVKWMTSQNAQIYATRNGGRYSLLSVVSIEAEQSIGISLPETGEYTISIPEECDASEYETVWLKDKETGKAIDLKEGDYRFHASQAGEQNHRFTISFNRMATDMKSDISIQAIGFRTIVLKGLQPNDLISVYAADGVLALQKKAKAEQEQVRTAIQGNVIVEVTRGGKQVAVRKIALK
ncbi:hypothetical protein [Segatella copri]|uniref:hypothetical protein n=1 Tax=Segatella copri TaxID=165179 RepID=UPI001933CA52|nr:hypothetical protein [Segatella copri]MBM0144140.1 hypothetical protein [Segatella copri]